MHVRACAANAPPGHAACPGGAFARWQPVSMIRHTGAVLAKRFRAKRRFANNTHRPDKPFT
jgi:hypothetical protein